MCPDYKKQQTKIKTKTKLMCLDNKQGRLDVFGGLKRKLVILFHI